MLFPSLNSTSINQLRRLVWRYYARDGRPLPWRENLDPYAVVVSEVMLQQTQVARVVPKFNEWLARFPTFETLAEASPAEVISVWQGLGYNRRALFLRQLAIVVVTDYAGQLPQQVAQLETLPGIGPATARSIAAFAFNAPVIFIETNIRRVFLHHFFPGRRAVADRELLPYLTAALPRGRAREWYWALMDYGSFLATQVSNPNRRSRHYTKQSQFKGSRRQLRGALLRALVDGPKGLSALVGLGKQPSSITKQVLADLTSEGFIVREQRRYQLKS